MTGDGAETDTPLEKLEEGVCVGARAEGRGGLCQEGREPETHSGMGRKGGMVWAWGHFLAPQVTPQSTEKAPRSPVDPLLCSGSLS